MRNGRHRTAKGTAKGMAVSTRGQQGLRTGATVVALSLLLACVSSQPEGNTAGGSAPAPGEANPAAVAPGAVMAPGSAAPTGEGAGSGAPGTAGASAPGSGDPAAMAAGGGGRHSSRSRGWRSTGNRSRDRAWRTRGSGQCFDGSHLRRHHGARQCQVGCDPDGCEYGQSRQFARPSPLDAAGCWRPVCAAGAKERGRHQSHDLCGGDWRRSGDGGSREYLQLGTPGSG